MQNHLKETYPSGQFLAEVEQIIRRPDTTRSPERSDKERVEDIREALRRYDARTPTEFYGSTFYTSSPRG